MNDRNGMKNKFDKYGKPGVYMQLLLKVGLIMILSILLFFGLGMIVLTQFNWPSGVMILFVFTGVGLGFFKVYQEIKKME